MRLSNIWPVIKSYGLQVGMALALFHLNVIGLIAEWHLILGEEFPDGYDTWIWALVTLSGASIAGMGVIRATGVPYQTAKAGAAPSQVIVSGDASVQTAAQPTAAKPAVPQAGVKPSNPEITNVLEPRVVPVEEMEGY